MKTINFDLNGKIAIVTGASRGIGEAISLTLSEYGAHVIPVSRKIEGIEKVARNIEEAGGRATPIPLHTGKLDQIESLFNIIKKQFGKLDILINNAATNPYFGTNLGVDEKVWNKTNEVNLKGPFFIIQNAAKLMAESGGGSIVNIASVNGVRPALFQGTYAITKAGLICMTKSYALELADKNIRVNAIVPGLIETRFSEAILRNEENYKRAVQKIPLGRHGKPMEVTGAVLYLVSDAASYTTGACIPCDGGMLI